MLLILNLRILLFFEVSNIKFVLWLCVKCFCFVVLFFIKVGLIILGNIWNFVVKLFFLGKGDIIVLNLFLVFNMILSLYWLLWYFVVILFNLFCYVCLLNLKFNCLEEYFMWLVW